MKTSLQRQRDRAVPPERRSAWLLGVLAWFVAAARAARLFRSNALRDPRKREFGREFPHAVLCSDESSANHPPSKPFVALAVVTVIACGAEQASPAPATGGVAAGASAGTSGAFTSGAGTGSITAGSHNVPSGGTSAATGGTAGSGTTSSDAGTVTAGASLAGTPSATGAVTSVAGTPNAGGAANVGGTLGTASAGSPAGGTFNAGAAATAGTSQGGSSAGAAGANTAGQPVAGSSSSGGCSVGKYLLCEDFETTAVGTTPSGWTRHGEQAAVSDDAAKRGSHSLKLGPVAASERRIYHDAALLGAAHWGRIFYKVKQPVPNAFVHSTLVSLTGDAPQRGASEFRVIDTVKQAVDTRDVGSLHQYLYNVQVTGGSEFSREGPYDQKFEDVWRCVEYHIEAATQSYELYIDGKQEIAFEDGAGNYAKSDIPRGFAQLRVGFVNYQQAPPGFTAWIDEIAFDDERIGCD